MDKGQEVGCAGEHHDYASHGSPLESIGGPCSVTCPVYLEVVVYIVKTLQLRAFAERGGEVAFGQIHSGNGSPVCESFMFGRI